MTVTSCYFSKLFFPSDSPSDREFANELFPELDPKNGGLFSFNLEQHKVAPKLSSIVSHTPPFSFAAAGIPSIQHCSIFAPSFSTLQKPLLPLTSNLLDPSLTTLKTQRITRKRKSFSSTKQTHTCKDCHETKTLNQWQKIKEGKGQNGITFRCSACYQKTLPDRSPATHTCKYCNQTKKRTLWKKINSIEWRCYTCYQKSIPSRSKAKHTCNDCHLTKNITAWKRISRTLWRCNACYLKTLPSHSRTKHTCISCQITKNVTRWRRQKVNDNEINYLCHTCYQKCKK